MAWNTGTSFVAGSAWGATQANGVGLDLRTWGGAVDGGGYNLANVGALTCATLSATALGAALNAAGYSVSNLGNLAFAASKSITGLTTLTMGAGSGTPGINLNGGNSGADGPFISGKAAGVNEWLIASTRCWTAGGAAGLALGTLGATGFSVYTNSSARVTVSSAGVVRLHNTPVYADNTAARAGGLTAGMQYRTAAGVRMEVF